MDVRVKMTPIMGDRSPKLPKPDVSRLEVVTGLKAASVKALLEELGNRHPELADVFEEARKTQDLRIYVNNDEVPAAETPRYFLRDGDTVSLFVKP
jgi:molybdopterin converting factor small subunit